MNKTRYFCAPWQLACLGLFFAIGLLVTMNHELWRDEMQHWAISAACESPTEIFQRIEYENSPALWHFILYGITRLTQNPVAMQVVHVLIATIGAAIFLWFAPFSTLQRVLFLFGYYSAYEYCVISRHYVLEPLFLYLFLACFPWQKKRAIFAALALFMLSQTSLFGLIMVFAATVAWLARHLRPPEGVESPPHRQLVLPITIIAAGGFWSFSQIIPPPDSAIHPYWDFLNGWRALRAGTSVWRSFVPFPAFRLEFWNTNILDTFHELHHTYDITSLTVQCALTVAILIGSIMLFCRRPESLAMFGIITALCLSLFFFKKLGYIRHHGHVFIAWIAALWLLWVQQPPATEANRRPAFDIRRFSPWLTCLFVIHVGSAAYAGIADYLYPFSRAEETANWIRSEGMQDAIIMAPAVIASHLHREVFIYDQQSFGSYRTWKLPYPNHDPQKLITAAERFCRTRRKPVLIVIGQPIDEDDVDDKLIRVKQITGNTIVPDAKFYLYTLRRPPHLEAPRHASDRSAPDNNR